MAQPRPIVVVLGMYRSGTSMLTRLLNVRGLQLGTNLLPAKAEHNSLGYWEHRGIIQTQGALFQLHERDWMGPSGMLPFPPQWWTEARIAPYRAALQAIVQKEMALTEGLWGFKDPRTARLLPLWHQIFEKLDLQPLYILSVRHPLAVADSLKRALYASSPTSAQLLWLQHYVDAVRYTRGRPLLVIPYDDWFERPRELLAAVDRFLELGAAPEIPDRQLEELIRTDMRHHGVRSNEQCLPVAADLYRLLLNWPAAQPAPPPLLDLVARIEAAEPLLSPVIRAYTHEYKIYHAYDGEFAYYRRQFRRPVYRVLRRALDLVALAPPLERIACLVLDGLLWLNAQRKRLSRPRLSSGRR